MSRERLSKLRRYVKPKHEYTVLDGYTEVDGDVLKIYTRSHRLAAELPGLLARDYGGTTGEALFMSLYPTVVGLELFGPHGEEIETGDHDKLVQRAVMDPGIQRVMLELGAQLVCVRPTRRRKR